MIHGNVFSSLDGLLSVMNKKVFNFHNSVVTLCKVPTLFYRICTVQHVYIFTVRVKTTDEVHGFTQILEYSCLVNVP